MFEVELLKFLKNQPKEKIIKFIELMNDEQMQEINRLLRKDIECLD